MARFATIAKLIALFTLLTVVMTWPQAATIATAAQDHQDVFFNMWRFAWVAHALSTSPARLFDGNIFYPEPRTLTFSDAMPVEALLAAPLLWAGTPPVLVHNVMLLAGIVLSAAGIAVLARSLTGSLTAGVTAGIVFAFAPYRFEHYMHMELQWTVWIPWTFWALHRTLRDRGRGAWKYGALTGVFMALQFMSSIYYGVFLATLAGLVAVLLLCGMRGPRLKDSLAALAIGAMLAIVLAAPYAAPYLATKQQLGGRSEEQVLTFSAPPSSYTVATDRNYLYGERSAPRGRPERRLFPGILPCCSRLSGCFCAAVREAIAYLLALAAAFEMSLGAYGYSFSFLYRHVPCSTPSARPHASASSSCSSSPAGGLGTRGRRGGAAADGRRALAVAICGVLLLEYWVAPLRLVPYPNAPPPLYAWLAQQPRGVVAEFPMPVPEALPGDEARYA